MDKYTVIVEVNGAVVDAVTYSDLPSAQMMQESKRMYYAYHRQPFYTVVVWIKQS